MPEVKKEIIISVKDVEVSFLVQPHGINSIKQYLFSLGSKKLFEKRKVLRGVDLEIYKGECIGLLGRNGSGKSTLLRTIGGIISPEKGLIKVYGRIAPMLALGVGLEPEMTGLENIYLCASLMGMSRKEIDRSRDEIIDFSELGEAIHMQTKRYSSGMMARLAFSIAISNSPDILIVDEALGVGDAGYQQKCFKRIQDLRNAGTTIIYVSHFPDEIKNICDRAAFLKDGKIVKVGDVKEIVELYLNEFA